MGGTYTLGVSPQTEIKQNHIHTIYGFSYGGWGAYNDEGSSYITTSKNIISDTNSETVFIHYGANLVATENVLIPGTQNAFQNSRDGNADWDWTISKNTVLLLTGYVYGAMTSTSNWTTDSNLFLNAECPFAISARYPTSNLTQWQSDTGFDKNSVMATYTRNNLKALQSGDFGSLPTAQLESLGISLPEFQAIGLQSDMLTLKDSYKIDTCRPLKDYNFDFELFTVEESFGGTLYTVSRSVKAGDRVSITDDQPSETAGQKSLWFYSNNANSPSITLRPTQQMDGVTDVNFDLFLNESLSGVLIEGRNRLGGPMILIRNQTLTVSGLLQTGVVVPLKKWIRFSMAIPIGSRDYTYSMTDLTTGQRQDFTVPSAALCTFGPFSITNYGALQTSFYIDNIGVNSRGPSVTVEKSAENTVLVRFTDQFSDLCGLDLFVDNALYKRVYRDELANKNEVTLVLNGVLLGQRTIYALAKTDRNHTRSSALALEVVEAVSPTSGPQTVSSAKSLASSLLSLALILLSI